MNRAAWEFIRVGEHQLAEVTTAVYIPESSAGRVDEVFEAAILRAVGLTGIRNPEELAGQYPLGHPPGDGGGK